MLERLQSYAVRLLWMRPLALWLGVVALIIAGYGVVNLDTANSNAMFIPALLLFCWCVLAYCLISVFHHTPPKVKPDHGFFKRQAVKLQRAARLVIALGFLALTLSLVVMSYKMIVTGVG